MTNCNFFNLGGMVTGKNIPFVSGSDTTGQLITQYKSLLYNYIKQLFYVLLDLLSLK